jgi:hypothetical protein
MKVLTCGAASHRRQEALLLLCEELVDVFFRPEVRYQGFSFNLHNLPVMLVEG